MTGRSWSADPEALLVAVALVVSGAGSLVGTAPGSIDAALPAWMRAAWAVTLLAGGTARVVGLLARRVLVDLPGCALIGPAGVIYGLMLLWVGWRALVPGALVLAIGVAHLVRVGQYWHLLRQYKRQARAARG